MTSVFVTRNNRRTSINFALASHLNEVMKSMNKKWIILSVSCILVVLHLHQVVIVVGLFPVLLFLRAIPV